MPESTTPSPLLVAFGALCMVTIAALIVSAILGAGLPAAIFAVGLIGSLVGAAGVSP